MSQQGDVRLFQTEDGGDIEVSGGTVAMDGGLSTAVYLSLFGGNRLDPGGDDMTYQWWGNLLSGDSAARYRSEVQHLLTRLPATAGNLRRLRDAAGRDLEWLKTAGIASDISVEVTIPDLNRVEIGVTIIAGGTDREFRYAENWSASR